MAWYQTLNETDAGDFYTITGFANRVSNGILFPSLLATIFLISMIGMISTGKSFVRSLTFAGFICSILSVLLVVLNYLNITYMYFCFIVTGLGLIGVRFLESPS